ncbi:outer membrane beta-barrel family protein [Hymenobacter crusticola]|uniref:Outer membrane protein beta-barrel domain-containing protein n=1 Tax=Hymenobacter crusticola TaxID=1770526 RepID=A0A243W5I0_9BACT|nr:outer membrane beta-barrel family protein [Hymenobacter crusticola]OUJ68684.1 hypothetical protein BXP70_27550 [Hymenobacter crusticola]
MKVLLTLCLASAPTVLAFAQTTGTVSGRLLQEQQQPLPFATVLLRPVQDTTQLQVAQSAPDGGYRFGGVASGRYFMTVSLVGYQTHRSAPFELPVGQRSVTLPAIRLALSAQQLQGVEVVGRKPLLEMQAGKTIVNVAGSLTAGATALEALERVPGLVVMNDRLSIAGREGVIILLDGRTTRYTDVVAVLKDFPSNNIERIEVMTQPDASYEAAGNAGIINIILKKNVDLGTNGTLTGSAGYGRFGKATAGLDLNHRRQQLNLFGSYGYSWRKTYTQLNTERASAEADARFRQQSYQPRTADGHTLRVGADYFLTKRQTLGVLVNGYTNSTDLRGQNGTTAATGTRVETRNRTRRRTDTYAANFNYKLQLDSLGRELTADVDYSRFESGSFGRLANTYVANGQTQPENLRNNQRTGIDLASARVDYRWPVRPTLKLSFGTKASQATIGSTVDLSGGRTERHDDFRYQEAIQAGYAQAEGQHLGVSWQAGLRGELTHSTARLLNTGQEVDRRYGQLFPTLSVDKPVYKSMGLNLVYSRRIDRPSYQDLNPSIVYLDPYTSQRGNSFLKPQFTNNYKAALTYNKQPFVVLGYSRTRDVISLVTATEDNALYSTTENLDHLRRYSATFNAPLNFGKLLTGYAGVNVFYNEYVSQYLGSTYRNGRTAATFYGQVNVQLPQQFKFEASGYYQTAGLNGLINFRSFGVLNLGVQRSLLQERATLRLTVNDVFFSNKQRGTIRYQELDARFLTYGESRQARLSFSYQLGNQQLKAARKRTTSLEEERGRVKSEKE